MSSPYTIAQAIQAVRVLGNDASNSHRVFPDSLTYLVDGTRTVFPLANKNIVAGTNYIKDGGAYTSGDSLVTDFVNGLVTVSPAPAKTLEWYYFYQDFTDTEIQGFVDNALGEFNMTETNLTTIPAMLYDSMQHFAAAQMDQVRAQRYAASYNATIEGETFDKSDVYKAYIKSAQDHYETAKDKRSEYYKRPDRAVAASVINTQSFTPLNNNPSR